MISEQSPTSPTQASEKRFSSLWSQLFGDTSIQVHFADSELNARVYTLDGASGLYRVEHKKVGGGQPVTQDDSRLSFPKKARQGEHHGRARLTRENVLQIRAWAAALAERKETPPWTAKAKEMNIGEGTLRDIVSRRTWTHV